MSGKSNSISVRVFYLCKICGVFFKCVSMYCTHKVEHHHYLEFEHNKSIVFEESTVEPNGNDDPGPGLNTADAIEWQIIQLGDLLPPVEVEVKQEPAEPVIFNSNDTAKCTANALIFNHVNLLGLKIDDSEPAYNCGIKTEWVEDSLVKYETCTQNEDPVCRPILGNNLQKNQDYNVTEAQSSFIRSDADADAAPSNREVSDGCHFPLEDFDLTPSTQSTSTPTTTDMEHEYFNENNCDSDDDIICLDDSPPPPSRSTANKIATSTVPVPTLPTPTATFASNNFILSRAKFKCQICSKQFSSGAQLGIHLTICELYNAAGPSQPQPQAVRKRIRIRRRVKRDSSDRKYTVNCSECSTKVRRCHFKTHLRTEHGIFVEDSDRKHVCHICGSAFHTRSRVERHARVHSDDRPFGCSFPQCPRAFKNELNLKQHLKTSHPQLI